MEKGELALVTILTPVYNGERYLNECIESVIKQTYSNWEYIIVNNCSTDCTLEIAQYYSSLDDRIKIHNNDTFVDVITNHNIAFSKISTQSKFCKILQADDWLFPECLEKMVNIAQQHSSIGVVSAYSLNGLKVSNLGLSYQTTFASGKEIARKKLLDELHLFKSPTSLLIDSKYIRDHMPYYNSNKLNADIEALFNILQNKDFGFVHQILTFVREHEDSMTNKDRKQGHGQLLSHLNLLQKFGSVYLKPNELSMRKKTLMSIYYRNLALATLNHNGKEFWNTQKKELSELGYKLNYLKLVFTFIIFLPLKLLRFLKKALYN